jgi:hypothetical protein
LDFAAARHAAASRSAFGMHHSSYRGGEDSFFFFKFSNTHFSLSLLLLAAFLLWLLLGGVQLPAISANHRHKELFL